MHRRVNILKKQFIAIPIAVGSATCSTYCAADYIRDPRSSYHHLLRYLKAAQVVIASQSALFRRCYGPEFIAEVVRG